MENSKKNSPEEPSDSLRIVSDTQGSENQPRKTPLSIQERFDQAARDGIASANTMTGSKALEKARRTSGYVATVIQLLPGPGLGRNMEIKAAPSHPA